MPDFYLDVDEEPPGSDTELVLAERYELRSVIGFGATAVVYEGIDTRTKRPIAIKILLPKARAQLGDFFGQEGRIAARVRNPHLAQASDYGEDQGRLYIVFDLLPGRPLGAIVRGTLLPCPNVCMVGLHVLDALAALHNAGVVHRDVKPDNIYVSEAVGDGLHATLLDVGFAAVLPPRRMTVAPEPIRAVFGTAGFIAPEVFGGHLLDPRSDLYSLGAVLYVALTGQPVPDFRTLPQIILPSPQVFRPEIPDALAAVVLKALSDVEARFVDADEMAHAITHALRKSVTVLVPAPASTLAAVPAMPPRPSEVVASLAEVATPPHEGDALAPPESARTRLPGAAVLAQPARPLDEVLAPLSARARASEPEMTLPAHPPELAAPAPTTSTSTPRFVAPAASMALPPTVGAAAVADACGGQRRASWRVTWALVVAAAALAVAVAYALLDGETAADGRGVDTAAGAAMAGRDGAAREPAGVGVHVVSPPLPGVDEALGDARAALRGCATSSGASFGADLMRKAGESRFTTIEIVGDEATTACARRVLDPLRFEPGDARIFTEEYRP